jgi:hypothetical protein
MIELHIVSKSIKLREQQHFTHNAGNIAKTEYFVANEQRI